MARVLLIDDAESFKLELKKDLQKGNHEITEASDGLQGLDILNKNHGFQLIISDLNMPNMNGLELCKAARRIEKYKNVPIIILTTESSDEIKRQGKDVGVSLWLTKPYSSTRLLSVINKLIP